MSERDVEPTPIQRETARRIVLEMRRDDDDLMVEAIAMAIAVEAYREWQTQMLHRERAARELAAARQALEERVKLQSYGLR